MNKITSRLKENFAASREDESGDIVQTLLIIALFVIIVIAIGKVIYDAVFKRAGTTSTCITSANPVSSPGTTSC